MKKARFNKQLQLTALLSIMLIACEHDTSFKIPPQTPRLVVHGYVQTGSNFSIAVGKTIAADVMLNPDSTFVTSATVSLYENGVFREVLAYDAAEKRYKSVSTSATAGKQYRITVSATGFETVESVSDSPLPVNTIAVNYIRNIRADERGNLLSDVIFRFDDPAAANNYYFTEINKGSAYSTGSYFCIYSYDPAVEKHQSSISPFEGASCIANTEVLYSDKSFNGARKEITLSGAEESMKEYTDLSTGIIYRPFLKRYFVTEEYFRYIKTGIAVNDISNDPFSQPVSTYTNVKNGYGLFTVFSAITDTLR